MIFLFQLGLLVACLCLFGNEMLLTSFYAASVISVSVSIIVLTPLSGPIIALCILIQLKAIHLVDMHFFVFFKSHL